MAKYIGTSQIFFYLFYCYFSILFYFLQNICIYSFVRLGQRYMTKKQNLALRYIHKKVLPEPMWGRVNIMSIGFNCFPWWIKDWSFLAFEDLHLVVPEKNRAIGDLFSKIEIHLLNQRFSVFSFSGSSSNFF